MSNLTDFLGAAASGGGTLKTERYESSTSWTVPDGVETVVVTLLGGGGGGASNSQNSGTRAASGGGGAFLKDIPLKVTPGETATITVGSAGIGDSSFTQYVEGTNGGNTSFTTPTSSLEAVGGSGAVAGSSQGRGGDGGWPFGCGGRGSEFDGLTGGKSSSSSTQSSNGSTGLIGTKSVFGEYIHTNKNTPSPFAGFGSGGRASGDGDPGLAFVTWVEK